MQESGSPDKGSSTRIDVPLPTHPYAVHLQADGLARIADFLPTALSASSTAYAIVTNTTVAPLYLETVRQGLAALGRPVFDIVLPDGESYKHWQTLQTIFDALIGQACDRRVCLVALGGGVVGDMTGFAAASYLRGVPFIQVPTTLLAQVDSSVGGKTGINHASGKNLIGAFHQPAAVLIDPLTLRTLPARELSAGLAELVKHGLIHDAAFVAACERNMASMRSGDMVVLSEAIARSIEIKAQIVVQDEREQGVRAHLNFGHTFGHAIEAQLGYGEWLHGEAVACGMALAARLSVQLGTLSAEELARIEALILALGGPVRVPPQLRIDQYLRAMQLDKKTLSGQLRFITLQGIGRAAQTRVDAAQVAQVLRDAGVQP